MAQWQIFVKGVAGKTSITRVPPNCKIDLLMDTIGKDINLPSTEMRIIFAGKQLAYGTGKYLEDYKLTDLSTVFITLRLKGGWNPLVACSIKKKELKPLPGFIRVVTGEMDMISLDDDSDTKRAKMPCDHVIGPDTMTSYAQSLVSEGKYRFFCPHVSPTGVHCNREWEYFLVRHVACLSEEEMKRLETGITENYIQKTQGYQQCPGCETWCFRENVQNNRMACQYCPKIGKSGRDAEFCWACLKSWTRANENSDCGNADCDGLDPRLRYLRDCPKKDIYKVSCPSVRSCPKCGILIEHSAACKHMTCSTCKKNFCFVCLKGQDSKGKWQCGSYSSTCEPAPVQTSLGQN